MTANDPRAEFQTYYYYGKSAALPAPGGNIGKTLSGYHYRCYLGNGDTLVFSSHNFRKGHAADIFPHDGEGQKVQYILKLRGSFPLTGKIDLIDTAGGTLCGVITRGGKVFDPDDQLICGFSDTRSWRDHLREGAVDTIGSLIFGSEGDTTASGATKMMLMYQGKSAGVLVRQQLPFFPDPPRRTGPGGAGRLLKKILPEKLGSALIDITPPSGWRLEIGTSIAQSHRLLVLCGALMTIEIQRW